MSEDCRKRRCYCRVDFSSFLLPLLPQPSSSPLFWWWLLLFLLFLLLLLLLLLLLVVEVVLVVKQQQRWRYSNQEWDSCIRLP
jgi:hypothetical protein